MVPRAEAQPGIEDDHGLTLARLALFPTRFEQQRVADLQRLEMPLPRLRPVLAAHLARRDYARADVQPALGERAESRLQFRARGGAPLRWLLQVGGDGGVARLGVEVSRGRLAQDTQDQLRDGLLGLAGGGDGNLGEGDRFHFGLAAKGGRERKKTKPRLPFEFFAPFCG